MTLFGFIYALCAGTVQGVTEWLPVSSTGHLILLGSLFPRDKIPFLTPSFEALSDVTIQLASVVAVMILYFDRLNPLSGKKSADEKRECRSLLAKIAVATVPAAALGFFLDDFLTKTVFSPDVAPYVVAASLAVYGALFIAVERKNRGREYRITEPEAIDFKTALGVGAFQVLSLIPGTSRSGSTILGASALGVSRRASSEFSFFMAIPVMFGATALRAAKFAASGVSLTTEQTAVLAVASVTAFLVSTATVKFLISFVRNHTFIPFGVYRIALAAAVLISRFA